MLDHGGRLRHAARQYGIAETGWLDLSTGINPNGWTVPVIQQDIWQRLPQDDDLDTAAQDYYGAAGVLAVAGSQAAVQALPMLRAPSQVALVEPSYAEHAHAWRRHGHQVASVPATEILQTGMNAEVVVIVNPNNPDGKLFSRDELLRLHEQLASRGGWLVVDEAFVDTTPEHSLASVCARPGLIVLRSLGKFFGLAGARVGFVLAENVVLQSLNELLGPWTIAAPSRHVATLALRDMVWQNVARSSLPLVAQRLADLLSAYGLPPTGGTSLFQWVYHADAASIHEQLARQGILTRLFDEPPGVRFGLPRDEAQWVRLAKALNRVVGRASARHGGCVGLKPDLPSHNDSTLLLEGERR